MSKLRFQFLPECCPTEISVSSAVMTGLLNAREVAQEADVPPEAEEDDEGEGSLHIPPRSDRIDFGCGRFKYTEVGCWRFTRPGLLVA
jgi:hypothetical protein